jgi:hypothetical protein
MKVTVKQTTQNIVSTVGIQGPPGVTRILDADDIDKTTLEDGAVLVYKAQTNKITTTRLLNQQVMEAGQY